MVYEGKIRFGPSYSFPEATPDVMPLTASVLCEKRRPYTPLVKHQVLILNRSRPRSYGPQKIHRGSSARSSESTQGGYVRDLIVAFSWACPF